VKRTTFRSPVSSAYGSAWLIFGLVVAVVMGVLAWPKVQEASRKAKVDTVMSVVRTYQLACLSFYGRNGTYPLDGEEGVPDGRGGFLQLPDGRTLQPGNTTLGDILVHKGYLPPLSFPLGTPDNPVAIRALSAEVLVRKLGPGILFASAPTATKVVVLVVPDLPIESARKLMHLFQKDKNTESQSSGSSAQGPRDCRLFMHPTGDKADAYLYLAHE
jgi:type II secretory pathway pseudopilin PulG